MNPSESELTQILKDVSKKTRFQGVDLVPGTRFGVKYPSARRNNQEIEIDETTDNRGEYPPIRPLDEENFATFPDYQAEYILASSTAGQEEAGGQEGCRRIPFKSLRNRLEIPGLMHPDDWMGKKPKKRKKKSADLDADKTQVYDSRNIIAMIKRKQRLMYGETIPPTQEVEQYPQDPSTLSQAHYCNILPSDVSNVLNREQNLHLPFASASVANTSVIGNFQYQPNSLLTSQPLLSNGPMFCLPNIGSGFSGPSMYPAYQPCASASFVTPMNTTNGQTPITRHEEQDIFSSEGNFFTVETPFQNLITDIPTYNENFIFQPRGSSTLNAGSNYLGLKDLESENMDEALAIHLGYDTNFGGSARTKGQSYRENPIFSTNSKESKQAAWTTCRQSFDIRENLVPIDSLNQTGNYSDNHHIYGENRESCSERHNIFMYDKQQQIQTGETSGNSSPVLRSFRASKRKKTSPRRDHNHRQRRNGKENDPLIDIEECAHHFKPRYPSSYSKFQSKTSQQRTRGKKIYFSDSLDNDCDIRDSDYKWRDATQIFPQRNKSPESTRPQARCISPDLFASQDFLNMNQNNGAYTGTSERYHGAGYTSEHTHFGFGGSTPDDETFERNFPRSNIAFEANTPHSNDTRFPRGGSRFHPLSTYASSIDVELGYSDRKNNKGNEETNNSTERTPDEGEKTPNDSDIQFSPKMSFKHTEDSYRSSRGGVLHVSTVEGEMVINPQQWRLAHKFTGLLGRKAAEVSRDLFKSPGRGELGRPRKVTATEELLHLYTTTKEP